MQNLDAQMNKLLVFSTLLFILSGCTVPPAELTAPERPELSQEQANEEDITGVITSLADGDTYNVVISKDREIRNGVQLTAGEEITVRLLLVDTPESVGEKAGMPYANEASSYAKGLLKGKTVTLEFDEGDLKDKYDRFLAYVYLDGKRVQDYLLENGYAMVHYVSEPNTRYLSELQAIEKTASKQSIGIWSMEGYAVPGEGFSEVGSGPDLKIIGEDIKNKAQETADDFLGETIDSLFDSFSSQ